MPDDPKPNPHPQRKRWVQVMNSFDYAEAKKKADAVKGKIRKRPNGSFDVLVGTDVKAAKEKE